MPPKRARPRDLGRNWPADPIDDRVGEVARRLAIALRESIGERGLREIAALTQVDHTTIADVLRGNAWPDMVTVARLELGLGVALWPSEHVLGDGSEVRAPRSDSVS